MSYEDIKNLRTYKRFSCQAITELLRDKAADIRRAFKEKVRQAKSEAEIERIMYAVRKAI